MGFGRPKRAQPQAEVKVQEKKDERWTPGKPDRFIDDVRQNNKVIKEQQKERR